MSQKQRVRRKPGWKASNRRMIRDSAVGPTAAAVSKIREERHCTRGLSVHEPFFAQFAIRYLAGGWCPQPAEDA